MLSEVAQSIHARHPNGYARRNLGVPAVENKLKAILKHKRIPPDDCELYLRQIDRNHASMCASVDWRKNGNEFASSLRNYLAPTEERYDIELSTDSPKEPARLMA